MPTVNHNTLTTTDLHEPKGASTASEGMVYVANGAGSGTWTLPTQGWAMYDDSAAAQTFTSTASKIGIDGLGTQTEESYLPLAIRGSASLWDTGNNKVTPIAVGDRYDIRLDLPITAKSASPTQLLVELDISGGATPTNVIFTRRIDVTNSPFETSVELGPLFVLSTFLTNGGQIFLSTDTGTIDVTEPRLVISREFGEII